MEFYDFAFKNKMAKMNKIKLIKNSINASKLTGKASKTRTKASKK